MGKEEDDNVYIDLPIARRMINNLLGRNRKTILIRCQCGSEKFTPDEEKLKCSNCGEIFDPDRESSESPPESVP